MEMSDIYVNHIVALKSPGKKMKRASPEPARHAAAELSDEEMPDYENVSVMADKTHKPPAEMPPTYPAPIAPSTRQPAKVRIWEQKHLLWLYILMGICFLMWIALLSHAVVKDLETSGELKRINDALSEKIKKVSKDVELVKNNQVQIRKELTKYKATQEKALGTTRTTTRQS